MSEHLHDMDNIFKSAYRQFKEEPTADVWQKINAALDKKDAESYKKDPQNGNVVSLLLLLLLAGFILYETAMVRMRDRQSRKNSADNKQYRIKEKERCRFRIKGHDEYWSKKNNVW